MWADRRGPSQPEICQNKLPIMWKSSVGIEMVSPVGSIIATPMAETTHIGSSKNRLQATRARLELEIRCIRSWLPRSRYVVVSHFKL